MIPSSSELKLYSTFVRTITENEKRRQQSSSLYISLTSVVFVLLGAFDKVNYLYVSILSFVVSITWLMTILYFRSLAKSKFSVIKKMEEKWSIRPFYIERLYSNDYQKILNKRISLTHIEMIVPSSLLIISICYIIYVASIFIKSKFLLLCLS